MGREYRASEAEQIARIKVFRRKELGTFKEIEEEHWG